VLQVVSDFTDGATEGETFLEMMRASGRPLSFSLLQTAPGLGYRKRLELLEAARAEGLLMRAQVAPRAVGLLIGLQGTINPLARTEAFAPVAGAPLPEQARHLGDPEVKATLLAELRGGRVFDLTHVFDLGDPPDYEPGPDDCVAAVAARDGVDPIERYVDLLLADEGRALLYLPFLNYFDGNLDAAAEMLAHPFTVPGLSDGGAHVGTICDASFPTSLLTHWGRDRERGTFELPFLVQRQCRATAEAVGLLDRGLLAPGYRADLNVIDLEHLSLAPPSIVRDLPANGKRLMQGATGYLHTIVAGDETYARGEPTGALPGRFVRGPRADATTNH
jgi:N-acyl-D-aspartate/D-glutamate deacylase